MCVTNTTSRRSQPVAFTSQQVSLSQSLLSQRLLGTYLPTVPSKQPVYNHGDIQFASQFLNSVTSSSVPTEKPRPKRRRKPQKPGKTAKNNERHFVVHNYHDHSHDDEDHSDFVEDVDDANQRRRGGVSIAFPLKLHSVLDQVEIDGLSHVISWQKHGRAFVIHKPKEFVDHVMPKYFRQSKLTSFQRQLNLYGFCRLTRGADAGGYYHELFLRGKLCLCKKMTRTKVKGTKFKAASSPEQEPDFYQMPAVVVSPLNSDEDSCSHQSISEYKSNMNGISAYCAVSTKSHVEAAPLHYAQHACLDPSSLCHQQLTRSEAPLVYYPQDASSTSPVQPFQLANTLSFACDADKLLDEAVDELFLYQEDGDNLDEFVHDWDPSFYQSSTGTCGGTIEDDSHLGYLLEKLLDE